MNVSYVKRNGQAFFFLKTAFLKEKRFFPHKLSILQTLYEIQGLYDDSYQLINSRFRNKIHQSRTLLYTLISFGQIVFLNKKYSKNYINSRLKDNPFFEYELHLIYHLRLLLQNTFFKTLLSKCYGEIQQGITDSLYLDKYRLKHVFFGKEDRSWYDSYIGRYSKFDEYSRDPIWKAIFECFREIHTLITIPVSTKKGVLDIDFWYQNKDYSSFKYISKYYKLFDFDMKWSIVFLLRMLRYSLDTTDHILYLTYERFLYYREIVKSSFNYLYLFWLFFLYEKPKYFFRLDELLLYCKEKIFHLKDILLNVSLIESVRFSYYYIKNCLSKKEKLSLFQKDRLNLKYSFTETLILLSKFEQEQEDLYFFLDRTLTILNSIKNSKNRIASHYDFLISFLSRKYSSTGIDYEDILIYSTRGLYKAIDRFEVHKNCKFTTYAFWWVKQSVSKLIQDTLIRIPTEYLSLMKEFETSEDLHQTPYLKQFFKVFFDLVGPHSTYYYVKATSENKRMLEELKRLYILHISSSSEKHPLNSIDSKTQVLMTEKNETSSFRKFGNFSDYFSTSSRKLRFLKMLRLGSFPYRQHSAFQLYRLFQVSDNKFKSQLKLYFETES
uniref:Sigma-like factor n=1 Tax=Jakoba bahamiensis TaxID=221721 RepID=M4QKY3_9EUKA|nr:sigma-like factor [Jakoba bahamiensis]AGH24118.1 sigma-like factor [Jakoba bahamiensis]